MIKWDKPCYKCLSHFCDLSCEEPKHLQAPQRKPLTDEQGEPAAYVNGDALDNMLDDRLAFIQRTKSGYRATPLYTTPPQRKTLTDEEILTVARDHYNPHQRPEISFARAIEAAHGIKE